MTLRPVSAGQVYAPTSGQPGEMRIVARIGKHRAVPWLDAGWIYYSVPSDGPRAPYRVATPHEWSAWRTKYKALRLT
jgi:hypothetical protein